MDFTSLIVVFDVSEDVLTPLASSGSISLEIL